ncbi:alpha/beta fold hydrolase [Nocardia noduli]|uniref:alpha/beta fold hydrolase n=1 Tax=Nocardia noduli TaxID=2815722 RepID=UPI001C21A335|nr:alpha/beta hydrolase [Nocardia noduli]
MTETLHLRVGELVFEVRRWIGSGNGVSVLLLHGFPQSAASWEGVADCLSAQGVSMWAPNQRGYSCGARPAGVENYRLAELVGDVVAFCDELSLDRVHLVGHDWGAVVAWAAAARHPERIASVTALSVPHPAAFARAIADDPEQQEKSTYIEFLKQSGSEDLLVADGGAALRLAFGDAIAPAIVDRHLAPLLEPGAMTCALNWYRAIGDDWKTLPPVSVPSTLVWGTEDVAVARAGVDLCAEYVHADLDVVILQDRGHWLPEEVPEEVAAAICSRIGIVRDVPEADSTSWVLPTRGR